MSSHSAKPRLSPRCVLCVRCHFSLSADKPRAVAGAFHRQIRPAVACVRRAAKPHKTLGQRDVHDTCLEDHGPQLLPPSAFGGRPVCGACLCAFPGAPQCPQHRSNLCCSGPPAIACGAAGYGGGDCPDSSRQSLHAR